jgi:thiamine-monophosphate kinase
MRLSDLGELELLAELERRGLVSGISDDAALIEDGFVVTHDLLLEDVHFRRDRVSWRELGYKAAAVNLSDLAASGAEARGLLVGLGLPGELHLDDVLGLYEGLGESRVPILGGDTSAAEKVVVAVTAVGRSKRVPGRSGARPGNVLVVTGPLGAAGHAFREGRTARPPLRLEEGRRLGAHAHAMLDLSDGIGIDAARIATRSGCRLVIELDQVPLAESATIDDLSFGEDYELLAAVDDPVGFPVIGRCERGSGVEVLLGGRPVEIGGWEHFK